MTQGTRRALRGLLLAACCAGLAACTFRVRESNIVVPRVAPAADVAALRAQFPQYRIEERRIPAGDGAELYSLRFLRPDAIATVLYFGGNGYTVSTFAPFSARVYSGVPVNFVLVDHRGYGASTGTASIAALMDDAVAVYDELRGDAELQGLPLVVHGHSLGSFMAGHVAAERRLDGLVLEASATTSEEWTAYLRTQQKLWVRMLVRRVVPEGALAGTGNLGVASSLDEPTLFVVGENDDVVPPRFARALYAADPLPPERKRLLVVPGHGHPDAADSPEFRSAFSDFVASIANRKSAMNAGTPGTAPE
jgi:pimeloyl-ACP methyl ester carboxylesterase